MLPRLLGVLLLIILPSALCSGQGEEVPQEYLIKAKYVLNIPLYTEMPAKQNKGKSYNICVIGATPMQDVLELSRGKLIKNRPLKVVRLDDVSQVESCQMLFIASSERHRLQTLLPEAHRRGVLTISDMRDFTRMGGMLSLINLDNRITFDLNLAVAGKASVSFSSQILKLAHDIIR